MLPALHVEPMSTKSALIKQPNFEAPKLTAFQNRDGAVEMTSEADVICPAVSFLSWANDGRCFRVFNWLFFPNYRGGFWAFEHAVSDSCAAMVLRLAG